MPDHARLLENCNKTKNNNKTFETKHVADKNRLFSTAKKNF